MNNFTNGGATPNEGPFPPPPLEGVPLTIVIAKEDRRRLRQLALDANVSIQKLGHEAWNMLLAQRGLDGLVPMKANMMSGRNK